MYFSNLVLLGGIFLSLLGQSSAAADTIKEPKRLFRSHDLITLTFDSDWRALARDAVKSKKPYPAVLTYENEVLNLTVAARGESRRKRFCDFPPLKIEFLKGQGNKPPKNSLFRGQKKLKLVTHCQAFKRYERLFFREYTAYRLYEVLAEHHLKVRLAKVRYLHEGNDKITRYAFFIEDTDDAAERLGLKEVDVERTWRNKLSPKHAAFVGLWQYMLGNLDWSMTINKKGKDCCHNMKLIGEKKSSTDNLIPVPYDFDGSGFVDADYIAPPKRYNIKSVRERVYRGYCQFNNEARALLPEIVAKEQILFSTVDSITLLEGRDNDSIKDYLDKVFKIFASDERSEEKLFKKCV